jgi:hypothetical protein
LRAHLRAPRAFDVRDCLVAEGNWRRPEFGQFKQLLVRILTPERALQIFLTMQLSKVPAGIIHPLSPDSTMMIPSLSSHYFLPLSKTGRTS